MKALVDSLLKGLETKVKKDGTVSLLREGKLSASVGFRLLPSCDPADSFKAWFSYRCSIHRATGLVGSALGTARTPSTFGRAALGPRCPW